MQTGKFSEFIISFKVSVFSLQIERLEETLRRQEHDLKETKTRVREIKNTNDIVREVKAAHKLKNTIQFLKPYVYLGCHTCVVGIRLK